MQASGLKENTMQADYDVAYEAALKLPESERLALVSRLMETMPAEDSSLSLDDASLIEELDRRFADNTDCIPWSQLKAEI
jgi:putative addiction module component (TIGR02574 family)